MFQEFPFCGRYNNAPVILSVQAVKTTFVLLSFVQIQRNGTTQSKGESGFTSEEMLKLFSHQQCIQGPVYPHPGQHWLLTIFLTTVIQVDVW